MAPGARPATAGTGGRPGAGRGAGDEPRRRRRWLPSWRLVVGALATLMALGVGAFVVAYASTEIPTPDDFVTAQTTTVYYSDGTTQMGTFGEQNRVLVESGDIPDHVKQAVVAGEDRSFYENPGINPTGIVRALWNNLRGGDQQGGSSITQQYAERYYINRTVTDYRGKLREAILAIKLDRRQDKDEILGNYLNTIYFGRDSYGIETAAQAYFGVSASELTVSQGALLAGVIPSPNNFDPRVDPEEAERRWEYIVDGMVQTGALTQADRDDLTFPETVDYARSDTFAGPQGYLLDMVRREVVQRAPITEEDLNLRGYRIVTTVDTGLQDLAVQAVDEGLPDDHSENLRVGLVSLDPADGAVVALYGGPDFVTSSFNSVTQATAQAGSTFKPFTLVANLEEGNSLRSRYQGTNRLPVEGFENGVRNFSDQSFGRIDVVEATAKSVNAVYAQMNVEVGPSATAQVAVRAGLPEDTPGLLGPNNEVPANVLGTASPHPIDMAEAFNTFAAQGVHHEPFVVRTVEQLDGDVVYQAETAGERAFEEDVMADTTYALTQVVEARGATARGAQEVGHPVAGKTGTSNENRSAWFIGYTRHLTTAVALFQEGPSGPEPISPIGGTEFVTGGSYPLDIWTAFMRPAMDGREVLEFPERADVGEPNVPPLVDVPSVVGLAEGDAVGALEAAGFAVSVQRAEDEEVAEGVVAAADPDGGEAQEGSTVTIVVSTGPPPEPTPTEEPEPEDSEGPRPTPTPTQTGGGGDGDESDGGGEESDAGGSAPDGSDSSGRGNAGGNNGNGNGNGGGSDDTDGAADTDG